MHVKIDSADGFLARMVVGQRPLNQKPLWQRLPKGFLIATAAYYSCFTSIGRMYGRLAASQAV